MIGEIQDGYIKAPLPTTLVPSVTSTLKQISSSYYPWDLLRYGDAHPDVHIFRAFSADRAPGLCLPAEHASGALRLLALAVCWLPARSWIASRTALLAIAYGGIVGSRQQIRGAHFMTQTLWSIWIACAIVVALIVTLQSAEP